MELPCIIPFPSRLERIGGECVLLPSTTIIAEPNLDREARYLACYLRTATGYEFPIKRESQQERSLIRLSIFIDVSYSSPEGHRINVQPNNVNIEGATSVGVFRAIQSFLQLLPAAVFGSGPRSDVAWRFPIVEIEDFPRFSWRGAMLDCGRFFYPKEFIKRFIDQLALHKLNVFHWHLTEDQGWRIEIKKYPKLTQIGAFRKESPWGSHFSDCGGDGIPHGGFYTQEDIREIVEYASVRHIEIVPEIEMPGHAQAAIAAYPQLGCEATQHEVSTKWGVHDRIFNPSDETIGFIKEVLEEVFSLFPGRYIHIGGDEAVKVQWKESPTIQVIKRNAGCDTEDELQRYFIGRINEFIIANGRKLVGWDEISEGAKIDDVTIMSWRGSAPGVAAANAGSDVVMTPNAFTYFDFYQSTDVPNEPLAIGGCLPLEKVFGYEPIDPAIIPSCVKHILGIQGQVWTEYMPTWRHVEYMAFPRISALAEVAWSSKSRRPYECFAKRLTHHKKRWDVLGVRYFSV